MGKKMKMIDLFAGVGGIRQGFTSTGNVDVVFSSDIDLAACRTYKENYEDNSFCDITKVNEKEIPDFDIVGAGFPCQAFSLAGNRLGFEDTRGTLFFDVARIVKEKKPKIVFLENVKGLVSHDNGKTFEIILKSLKDLGYDVFHEVLNSCEHGNVPQNRERIYIVGFRKDLKIKKFEFPKKIKLTNTFDKFIDRSIKQEDKYYYTDRFSIYSQVKDTVTKIETAYQWRRVYVRENKNNVCPTLTANMGSGGHNVPLIKDNFGIRKLTPRECFDLQGFPKSFKLPEGMADSKLYKQAGNSVSVTVIKRIAEQIMKTLENSKNNK